MMASLWHRYRRNGIRQTKSILASIVDVVSDWVFYLNVKENEALNEKFGFYLFIFAGISSGMLLALLLSFLVSARAHARSGKRSLTAKYAPFGSCLKTMLGLQMILEDIPQFVLGALVRSERGSIAPYLVFTWTTSGFNFLLNLLDMIEIEEDGNAMGDETSEENETNHFNNNNNGGETKSSGPYDYERGERTAQLY